MQNDCCHDHHESRPPQREITLWAACLKQAVDDLHHRDDGIKAKAVAWFATDDDDPGTFQWICSVLEIDAVRIRQRIKERQHDPQTAMKAAS